MPWSSQGEAAHVHPLTSGWVHLASLDPGSRWSCEGLAPRPRVCTHVQHVTGTPGHVTSALLSVYLQLGLGNPESQVHLEKAPSFPRPSLPQSLSGAC